MPVSTPDWLTQRGVHVQESKDGRSWVVYLGKEPQYALVPVPAKGQYSCRVTQTINGQRLDRGTTYHSLDAALQGGLDELRQALGW